MRSFAFAIGCLVVSAFCASPLLAEDEEGSGMGAGGAKHKPVVVEVKYFKDGKEVTGEFDMAKPSEAEDLKRILMLEHVDEIEKYEKLDIFQIKRWDLGIWSVVIFVLLFLALAKFAWKPMLEGLHKREESIRTALEQAEKTRREALEQHEKLQSEMKESAGQVAAMIEEGRRDTQTLKDKMMSDAKAEIQHERDRLLGEIESAKDQALREIWQLTVTVATSLSAKVLGRSIGEEDHRRLLDESLAELKEAGTGFGSRKLSGAGGI